jgi:hypothetical protein
MIVVVFLGSVGGGDIAVFAFAILHKDATNVRPCPQRSNAASVSSDD